MTQEEKEVIELVSSFRFYQANSVSGLHNNSRQYRAVECAKMYIDGQISVLKEIIPILKDYEQDDYISLVVSELEDKKKLINRLNS